MEERLRLVWIHKYGPGSEKLSEDQLELLELEPGVSSSEVEAERQCEQQQLSPKTMRKHPGRQELPAIDHLHGSPFAAGSSPELGENQRRILCRSEYRGRWWDFQANQAIGSLLLLGPLMNAFLEESGSR